MKITSKMFSLLALGLVLASTSTLAIYPIYKCTKTYTRVQGGDWVEHTYCNIIGFGGTGNWNVESERESPRINYEFEYVASNGQQISAENAISSCLNDSQARLESCQAQSSWYPCEKSFLEYDDSPLVGYCFLGDDNDVQQKT